MKSPQRVVWTEGMFLTPQHFQQFDRYHEDLVHARLGAVAGPDDWGVLAVEIDQRALAAGQVRLSRFAGVLPGGLPLEFGEADAENPPARPIESHFASKATALDVYLAVPLEHDGAPNCAPASGAEGGVTAAARTRFVSTNREISDATAGTGAVQVAFAQRNVTILFGDERRDDFEALKVAEITRDKSGALVVAEQYIPPCLRIGGSPFIIHGLRRLLTLMLTKQRALADMRRERQGATVEFSAGDVTRFLLLNAINGFIPIVGHLAEAGDYSPRACYLLLCQFAGQLCSFSLEHDPSKLPSYSYLDLRATFEQLLARITALLMATVRERCLIIPLECREDGMHLGRFEGERLSQCREVLLAVKATVPESQTAESLPKLSKIASWQDIPNILTAAVAGVKVQVSHQPPSEVPVKMGTVYFTLSTSGQYWQGITAERTVAVYLPPPFKPTETKLELLGVPPAGADERWVG
jgi:type VI secretion system protein ImpJ